MRVTLSTRMISKLSLLFLSFQLIAANSLQAGSNAAGQTASFTVEQIKSYPFPNELTAAATGSRIAWAFNENGRRNVWVAEGPDFQARQ